MASKILRAPLSIFLSFAIYLACVPMAMAQEEAAASGGSRIVGKVKGSDGAPITGARVQAYHLSTEKLYSSEPTGSKGQYVVEGLPYGYYDLAVETVDGLFVGNQVANVAPSSKAVLNFTLSPLTADNEGREFPGTESSSAGIAQVTKKAAGRQFWRSAKGIAVIAGGGAAVLLLVAGGGGSGGGSPPPVSPATP